MQNVFNTDFAPYHASHQLCITQPLSVFVHLTIHDVVTIDAVIAGQTGPTQQPRSCVSRLLMSDAAGDTGKVVNN